MQTIDKRAVAAAFGRAASGYDSFAELQRQCGDRLMRLARSGTALDVLDAGCGTGWFSQQWKRGGHRVTALDISAGMLQQAALSGVASHYREGDIEALPFADGSFDRCWSNLAVQWCNDLQRGLRELCRVTRSGGQVLFSTLCDGSLNEVEQAWRALDLVPPLNPLLDERAIADAGVGRVLRLEPVTLTQVFPDTYSLLRSLKGTGVTHLHGGRQAAGLTRQRLAQLEGVWPRDERGFLLTWNLMLGVIERE